MLGETASNDSAVLINTEANRLQPRDRIVHDWYRFVLSFPPHLVRECARRLGCQPGDAILDPFAGTGTTLVEAKLAGYVAHGIECHPMGHFACTVKTDWALSPERLVEEAEKVAESAATDLGLPRLPRNGLLFFDETLPPGLELRRLSKQEEEVLLKGSISPIPLHKALVLREKIDSLADSRVRNHLRLAFAKAVVADASNLHFGPEVGLGKTRVDAPLIECWLNRVCTMASDLTMVSSYTAPVFIYCEDARDPARVLEPRSIQFVITSPPYPNEKDYTRTTRLESVLLGFVKNKAELRELKRRLIRSNTRNVFRDDDDAVWVEKFESIQKLAKEVEARRVALGKTSGFERLYHLVVRHYFGGMARHFANLRQALKKGAKLAYVVGDQASYLRVMIRTSHLIAEIADYFGYRVDGIELFRTRLATATRTALREEIVWLTWTGKERSCG